MTYRNIGGPLFEICHRVSTSLHQAIHQEIGIAHRRLGIIDKTRLHHAPLCQEALPLFSSKLAHRKLAYTLFPFQQDRFGPLWTALTYGPVVLRSETLLQVDCSLSANKRPGDP